MKPFIVSTLVKLLRNVRYKRIEKAQPHKKRTYYRELSGDLHLTTKTSDSYHHHWHSAAAVAVTAAAVVAEFASAAAVVEVVAVDAAAAHLHTQLTRDFSTDVAIAC